jgi:hypothetical protein
MKVTLMTSSDLDNFKQEIKQEVMQAVIVALEGRNVGPSRKWLKSHEVRKMLAVSPNTLQTLRVNGTLPYTKIGGVLYYDYEDIDKMLRSRKSNQYAGDAESEEEMVLQEKPVNPILEKVKRRSAATRTR